MSAAAAEDTIRLSLADTLRTLRRVDLEIAAEVRGEILEVAKEAAELAKHNAAAQGFAAPGRSGRGTGKLIDDIGYGARGTTGVVKEMASRNGYRYPGVFEFGRAAEWMHRPFLMPAVHAIAPEAVRRTEEAVERAIRRL
jgi:hypothetical protein